MLELARHPSVGGGGIPPPAIRAGDICRLQPLLSGSAKKKELAEARQNSVEGVISRVKESGVTLALRNDEEIPFGFESRCWLYLRLAVHQLTVESN